MLRLLRALLHTMAVLTRTKPSPPSPRPALSGFQQPLATDCTPVPDWVDGPVITSWHYHRFLRDRITGRPDLQEIAYYHFHRCFLLPSTTIHR